MRLHLIRHGRAAAGWEDDPDPGLDAVGREQAAELAEDLATLGPLRILTSPLKRARETAMPLAARWRTEPVVEPAVGEVPSPTADLGERSAWLRSSLRSNWADLGPAVTAWRSRLIATLAAVPAETVVFTHFVAINAMVGACSGDEALILCAPANASLTVIDVEAEKLSLVRLGRQADRDVG